MATILFNIQNKDSSILNNIPQTYIWNTINTKFKNLFIPENLEKFKIDPSYNYRPDKVSYFVYNNDLYYPLILFANEVNSIMQFRIDIVGTDINYLKPEFVNEILSKL